MKIEQVDREAAAELYLALDGDELTPSIVAEADRHRRGDYDLSPAIQAFARHRIQALEEAAKIMRDAIASGYVAPPRKVDRCAHGKFGWEDCISCYDDALDAAVSRFLQPGDGVNDPAANGD